MTTTELAYAATEQHILLLAEKQARLAAAQLAAEDQLIQAVAREVKLGNVTWHELQRLYRQLRDIRQAHFKDRWDAKLPKITEINSTVKQLDDPDGRFNESWSGAYPYRDGEPWPHWGTPVVYVLFDASNRPCYVGSTKAFKDRLCGHKRDGKVWSSWQAYRCRDREHAYQAEEQFLRQYMPYLNKRAGR